MPLGSFNVCSDAEERRVRKAMEKLPHLLIRNKTATMVHEFAVEDLHLDRNAALVPEFAVKDLPLGRTLWWWWWCTRRVIGIFGSLVRSKTLMETIFNPHGAFRWSPENSFSQSHSPHVPSSTLGIFSDLLRSVQMLKREGCGKQRKATAPIHPIHL